MDKPDNVFQGPDWFYYVSQDGISYRVCEDCWQVVPRYIDFPNGLVSPESDGDKGGNFAKHRIVGPPVPTVDPNKTATQALQKLNCLPCYLEAFARVYPGSKLPSLRSDALETVSPAVIVEEAEQVVPDPMQAV